MNEIKELIERGVVKVDTEVVIGTTKEYGLFNLLNCNREINQTNVNNIKKSILESGYCKCNEVIVDEMWNVIDGQHTFTACKELGMEIRFKMIEGLDVSSIMALNSNQRNWSNIDFIKSYANRGFESYKMLLEAIEKNKDITLSYILILMFDKRGNTLDNTIKNGTLKISEERLDRFYGRAANYRALLLKYGDRFAKRYVDDIRSILELLDNDFMSRMLENVFARDKSFTIDLHSKEVNQMKAIADKIATNF